MHENIYTTYLKVFHSVKIRYVPKQIFFEQDKMVAGTELAALDFNHDVNRSQVIHRFIVSQILSESLVIHVQTILLSIFLKKVITQSKKQQRHWFAPVV